MSAMNKLGAFLGCAAIATAAACRVSGEPGGPTCATDPAACDGGTTGNPDGGSGGGGVVPPANGYYMTQIQSIFDNYCNTCHTPPWNYARLVGVPANCKSGSAKIRVEPGDAGGSLLYLKITNDPAKCGNSMPYGEQPLIVQDPAAVQRIHDWIANGADAG